jgi:CheY-like chemotaxis protein
MRTLLLADDSITVQRVIALTFAGEPVNVVTVGDGQQAMEKIAAQRPDIILAGTTLPQVNGYDLARFVRNKPELKHIPVLLLSGAFETVDEARVVSSGANGVIEKPVEPTIVIGRVKELLGLKSAPTPAPTGRMVTSAGPAPEKRLDQKLPVPPPPRAPAASTRPVEDSAMSADNYLDTLDAAFDTLDQHLSGRLPSAKPARNPSGPLGQSTGAADPRSPGRRPPSAAASSGNPVFEVDEEWFGGADAAARASQREIAEDLKDPELAPKGDGPAHPIYEVDEEWFKEDERVRSERQMEQQRLAAEMGINDVELPKTAASGPTVSADDFAFGVDDLKRLDATPDPVPGAAIAAVPTPPSSPQPPVPVPALSVAPSMSAAGPARGVADDFAQLLAFEQGEHPEPPSAAAPEVKLVAPELTEAIIDQIASRVASHLTAGAFGDQLKDAMAAAMNATVRDTVRTVVSETSERLVRDEIDRIKSKPRT